MSKSYCKKNDDEKNTEKSLVVSIYELLLDESLTSFTPLQFRRIYFHWSLEFVVAGVFCGGLMVRSFMISIIR